MREKFTLETEEEEVEAVADDNHGEENAHKVTITEVRRGVPWELIKGFGFTKGYKLHRGDPSSVGRYEHRIVFTADRDAFNVNGIWRNVDDDPKNKSFLESLRRGHVPDEFEGDGAHVITEIYLDEGEEWEMPVEKEEGEEEEEEEEEVEDDSDDMIADSNGYYHQYL